MTVDVPELDRLLDAAQDALDAGDHVAAYDYIAQYRKAAESRPGRASSYDRWADELKLDVDRAVQGSSGDGYSEFEDGDDWWENNPDDWYRSGSVTVLYDADHGLITKPFPATHYEIMQEIGHRYEYREHAVGREYPVVLGRYWPGTPPVFSIWNRDDETIHRLLPECLSELMAELGLPESTVVYTPVTNPMTVRELLARHRTGQLSSKQLSPEEQERLELLQRLHLARGAEKRAIMRQLGLNATSQPNDWSRALRAGGRLAPGHDYWRMSSESKQRRFDAALRGLPNGSH